MVSGSSRAWYLRSKKHTYPTWSFINKGGEWGRELPASGVQRRWMCCWWCAGNFWGWVSHSVSVSYLILRKGFAKPAFFLASLPYSLPLVQCCLSALCQKWPSLKLVKCTLCNDEKGVAAEAVAQKRAELILVQLPLLLGSELKGPGLWDAQRQVGGPRAAGPRSHHR